MSRMLGLFYQVSDKLQVKHSFFFLILINIFIDFVLHFLRNQRQTVQ